MRKQPDRHRLRAAADEARARLDHLEAQREAALETCRPGPHPRDVEAARSEWLAAEDRAKAAEGMADA